MTSTRNTKVWRDIDLNFGKHPVTHDLVLKFDDEAIKASIRNILSTMNFERPFHSDIGSRLKTIMFEPITPVLYAIIKREVTNVVQTYEPRAMILDVVTTYLPDENSIIINVVFKINGTALVGQTSITLVRTR